MLQCFFFKEFTIAASEYQHGGNSSEIYTERYFNFSVYNLSNIQPESISNKAQVNGLIEHGVVICISY